MAQKSTHAVKGGKPGKPSAAKGKRKPVPPPRWKPYRNEGLKLAPLPSAAPSSTRSSKPAAGAASIPFEYLRDVFSRMPSMAASDYDQLVPDAWAETRGMKLRVRPSTRSNTAAAAANRSA